MPEIRRLTVRGRFDNIPTIIDFVAEAAALAGLDENEAFHCQMAVDEACTNVIEHAYGGDDRGDITITCAVEPGICTIVIVDSGRAFDPSSVPEPRMAESLEELRPGGIGLHLMRKLMDDVSFEFADGKNTLTMVKRRAGGRSRGKDGVEIAQHEVRPGIWMITPRGRLDSSASPQLEEVLMGLIDKGQAWLVVDMAEVTYISSRGLKTLVAAWRAARALGGDLYLSGLTPHVQSIFEMVGFTQVFRLFESPDQALSAIPGEKA
ncbi:MAG: anti-sigma factor antagonist [Anaerolineae bacterium]